MKAAVALMVAGFATFIVTPVAYQVAGGGNGVACVATPVTPESADATND